MSAPLPYHTVMTDADTEYSQELPRGTRYVTLQNQGENAMRFAFETGKVATPTAPYGTIKANTGFDITLPPGDAVTLYVASATAAQTVEIFAHQGVPS